jgi:ABC-type branched-subunit amino acid transport system ATPase component
MILEVEAVDTFYGETQALFGASLAVERGKVFALLGPNGAGKTTTAFDPGADTSEAWRDPVRWPRGHP